jgi:hypothetical protein
MKDILWIYSVFTPVMALGLNSENLANYHIICDLVPAT